MTVSIDQVYQAAKKLGDRFKISVSLEDSTIFFSEWVTMSPGIIHIVRKTLAGDKSMDVPGWVVEIAVVTHNYLSEPDDVDVTPDSEHIHPAAAIQRCINIIRENEVRIAMEAEEAL